MTTRLRPYIVGHYHHPPMRRPRLTARPTKWAHTLPPTMLACTITVIAASRAEAYAKLRARGLCDHRQRSKAA
jgi:hypothetical protein